MERLARAGGKPGRADYDGRTPAHLAAAEGRLRILKYLKKLHDVDLNASDRWNHTPLLDAIRHHHAETAQWLRANGAREGPHKYQLGGEL